MGDFCYQCCRHNCQIHEQEGTQKGLSYGLGVGGIITLSNPHDIGYNPLSSQWPSFSFETQSTPPSDTTHTLLGTSTSTLQAALERPEQNAVDASHSLLSYAPNGSEVATYGDRYCDLSNNVSEAAFAQHITDYTEVWATQTATRGYEDALQGSDRLDREKDSIMYEALGDDSGRCVPQNESYEEVEYPVRTTDPLMDNIETCASTDIHDVRQTAEGLDNLFDPQKIIVHNGQPEKFLPYNIPSSSPRHIPRMPYISKEGDPWSTYNTKDHVVEEPLSDESLVAPEQYPLASRTNRARGGEIPNYNQLKTVYNYASREDIDRPPPDNPVGPPSDIYTQGYSLAKEIPQRGKKRGRRTHSLEPDQREKARQMRERRACWWCKLCKYECDLGPYGECSRCSKKLSKSIIYECDRTPLPTLVATFLPDILSASHRMPELRKFCRQHVSRWSTNRIDVATTWGYGKPLFYSVNEVSSFDGKLLFQEQYRTNPDTGKPEPFRVPSPPLGIMLFDVELERKTIDHYLTDFLQENFRGFPDACFPGDKFTIERPLLVSLHSFYLNASEETKDLLDICLKLTVLTFIMGHAITFVEGTTTEIAKRLQEAPSVDYGPKTSSRWLNKEIKFIVSALHDRLITAVLRKLDQMLQAPKKIAWFTAAFASILVLAMTAEFHQTITYCRSNTNKSLGIALEDDEDVLHAVKLIEDKFDFLSRLFLQKYTRCKGGSNPLTDSMARDALDAPSKQFVREVSTLIENHGDFLRKCKSLEFPRTFTDPNTSRLVARFLLSFSAS